jgi:predicted short-subunit dehydrogenase-like oxidoreductase (DUF2520 family)
LAALADEGISCGALHPMQSFTSPEQGVSRLAGSIFAIDGDSKALKWASSIVKLLDGRSLHILPEHRNLYHAAARMAGNYIAALIYGALELLKTAGVGCSMALTALAPLAKRCMENSVILGPVEALTGPIEEGTAPRSEST